MNKRTGRCHCGSIRFEFSGEPGEVSFCHCSICRRVGGSAFAAYVEVSEAALEVSEVKARLSRYKPTERLEKDFCENCGVQIFTRHESYPGLVYINLCAMTDDHSLAPEYHQFVASKAKWHEISDTLPQYTEWPDHDQ
jgi:hypothetical protein